MKPRKTQSYFKNLSAAFNILNRKRPYDQVVLGQTHGMDLLLVHPTNEIPDVAHILIAAGFHGDEPAGPLAVLEYWKSVTAKDLGRVNLSFLPLVNPSGFNIAQRENASGDDPNRGFPHRLSPSPEAPMSAEGKILYEHAAMLARCSKSGFVSLHENTNYEDQSYLFSTELGATSPGSFSSCLRDAQKSHYPNMFNGVADNDFPEIVMIDGLAFNPPAFNCFEDLLLYDLDIPKVATTETAGSDQLNRRIKCNTNIIQAFVQHYTVR